MWSTRCQSRYKWWKIDFSNWCTRDCDLNFLVKHKKWIKIDFPVLYCMVWNRSAEWHALMQFYTMMASWLGVTVLLLLCFLPGRGTNSSEHQWDDRGYLIFCLCMGMSSVHFMHAMLWKAYSKRNQRCESLKPSKVCFSKVKFMYLFYNPNESSITAVPEYVGINTYV